MLESLTLVRHGESLWNAAQRIQGYLDSPLSPLGRTQARSLAPALRRWRFDAVYSSDLCRAMETAELATELSRDQMHLTDCLREISFGSWEGMTPADVAARYPDDWAAFQADPIGRRPPDGEAMEHLAMRVDRILEHWHKDYDGRSLLAFSHGGAIRMAVVRILGLPLDRWRVFSVSNTGVTRFVFQRTGPFLQQHNVTAHLHVPETAREEAEQNAK